MGYHLYLADDKAKGYMAIEVPAFIAGPDKRSLQQCDGASTLTSPSTAAPGPPLLRRLYMCRPLSHNDQRLMKMRSDTEVAIWVVGILLAGAALLGLAILGAQQLICALPVAH